MDQVKCKLEIPQVEGLNPQELTVGRHALLNCDGDWNKSFDFSKAQVKSDESSKYLLKVLKAEARSPRSFDVQFTTYMAGPLQFPDFILTDGTNEISLGSQQLNTVSVLEKPQPGQPPQKPYNFIFPLPLEWPTLYFILMVAVVILFLTALVLRVMKAARYARLIADLMNHDSAIQPDLQFYKTLRLAEKQGYPIDELEKAFRLYVLRVFKVPMFVLDNKQIVQFFKARKSMFKNERLQVERILSEFEEIRNTKKELSTGEKLELANKMYRFVDRTQGLNSSTGDAR